jgi:hypothetical protein
MKEGRGNGGIEMFGQHLGHWTTHEPIYLLDKARRVPVSHTEYYPCPLGRGKVTYKIQGLMRERWSAEG